MVNILDKISTLRFATATAQLKVSSEETIKAILEKRVPKGDVFEFSRAAGLLAVKKTSDVIPDCHPLPIEYTHIRHEIDNLNIHIYVEAATIYKTGLEVEAMHGASIVALTMYDMLKPIDKNIEISSIKLLNKKGGKSSFQDKMTRTIKTAVVVCSDSVSAGKKEDKAGKAIISLLEKSTIHTSHYSIIPDEKIAIQSTVKKLVDEHFDLILFTGGTGLSPRDITPESIAELIEREIPGIMEVARNYGQQRTPYAMLSRGIAGFIGNTLVITLPGSTNGAKESMQALFPYLKHIFKVIEGIRHD
jgi:molybdenum cofactor biosynthesis protein MoaC